MHLAAQRELVVLSSKTIGMLSAQLAILLRSPVTLQPEQKNAHNLMHNRATRYTMTHTILQTANMNGINVE